MLKARYVLAIVLALSGTASVRAQGIQRPTPPPVDYSAFMQLNNEQRLNAFNHLAAEQQVELILIHMSRWMAVNMSHLTPEQRQALIDFANVVSPRKFRLPGGYQYTSAWHDEVADRISRLFSPAEIRQALTIYGDYIEWPQRTP